MRYVFYLFAYFAITSCKQKTYLKEWIINNQKQIVFTADSLADAYHKANDTLNKYWSTASVIFNKYAPNVFGALAKKIGDSTKCIVVEVTFFRDFRKKKHIMIAAEDSTCLAILNTAILKTDSTENFIFGKKDSPLYKPNGDPLF